MNVARFCFAATVTAAVVVLATATTAAAAPWTCRTCAAGSQACIAVSVDPSTGGLTNVTAPSSSEDTLLLFRAVTGTLLRLEDVDWRVEATPAVNYKLDKTVTLISAAFVATGLSSTCTLTGHFAPQNVPATVAFTASSDGGVDFAVSVAANASAVTPHQPYLSLAWLVDAAQPLVGFGEQYNYLDLRGQQVPIFTREQGIGRGQQPITDILNLVGFVGGDTFTAYAARPIVMTADGWAMVVTTSTFSMFSLLNDGAPTFAVNGTRIEGRIWKAPSLAAAVSTLTSFVGRARAPPAWSYAGAIVGMQGGTAAVLSNYSKLSTLGCPMGAFWLQDWCGSREWVPGLKSWTGLWWNWEWNENHYPNHEHMTSLLRANGVRTLTYLNPMLTNASSEGGNTSDLFATAYANDYLVRHGPDNELLTVYVKAHLMDLTNPAGREWFKGVVKNAFGSNVSGMMTDFGEALPLDAHLYNMSIPPSEYHNRYPDEWFGLVREAVEELGISDDVFFFGRSAWLRSASLYSAAWQGDQVCDWSSYDGLGSVVTSLLSSGLSGTPFTHSDIGGYNDILGFHRTEELFYRWCELAAFTTFFRTHDGSSPTGNWQFHSSEASFSNFTRYAKLHAAWLPYRTTLVAEAVATGLPVARPLVLHYPADANTYRLTTQFLLGTELLVAPVTAKGATAAPQVYFPEGCWEHVWTNATVVGPTTAALVLAPLGCPAVFGVCGSEVLTALKAALVADGIAAACSFPTSSQVIRHRANDEISRGSHLRRH